MEKARAGNVWAMARLITLLEKRDPDAIRNLKQIYPFCGRAQIIGITGPPGAGKSCLISSLIRRFREKDKTVGVLAVDPTSPFSGGAILGDRVRMIDQSGDKGVFIRSLGSRGSVGGLSAAVDDAVDVLDMAGKDIIIVETVGVGQGEIEISKLAHSVILVLMPGCGDTMQAMKAGVMEIGDIIAVNKADRPGIEEMLAELSAAQQFKCIEDSTEHWSVPIVRVSSLTDEGIDILEEKIGEHYKFVRGHGLIDNKNIHRRTRQFLDILTGKIRDEFMSELKSDPSLQKWVERIGNLELNPYMASDQVIQIIKDARLRDKEQHKK